uniref:SKA complex subunit 1 n=1 Tax=Amazona collaria TaxID=241587 RepID=A0A8B9F1I4_9PSIT
MKGRITCNQINVVVNNLNKAIVAKYKIGTQYRYIKEENKDTESCYFIVEDDNKLFTCMNMDKRYCISTPPKKTILFLLTGRLFYLLHTLFVSLRMAGGLELYDP